MKNLKLLACLFILIFLHSIPVEAGSSDSLVSGDIIAVKDVKVAVQNFLLTNEHIESWTTAEIRYKYKLYDIDDSILGYYFLIYHGDEAIGYVITSALPEVEPILEYGEGTLQDEFEGKVKEGNKIYYLGALNYNYAKNKFELLNRYKEAKERTLELLKEDKTTDENIIREIETVELEGIKKNRESTDISDEWITLLNNNPIDLTKEVTRKVLKVDHISQRRKGVKNQDSACGPTVGAMIADFYHDEKKYKVRDNAHYGSWAKLVNHLYTELKTTKIGTTAPNFATYFLKHVRHDESKKWKKEFFQTGYGHSKDYIRAINSDNPVAIRFGLLFDKGTYAQWHFVTGIGYDKKYGKTGKLYVAVKDPDRSSGTKWFRWTTNRDYFQFTFVKR